MRFVKKIFRGSGISRTDSTGASSHSASSHNARSTLANPASR